jgi:hypothetical protein
MTNDEISNIRIASQKIEGTDFKTAGEVVKWMGAVQAQDFAMAKLALGLRIMNPSDEEIEAAFNHGEIIRTHLLRPTLHFVSAEDIYWMLELTSPQIKSSLKSRLKELELSENILKQSSLILEKMLSGGYNLNREEIASEFKKANINTGDNRLSHLLLAAELDGLICSGPVKLNKHTFGLLRERVPSKKTLSREESLARLAERYFKSHCPATIQDFVWWSGLSKKDAVYAVESVKSGFVTETAGSEQYLLPASFRTDKKFCTEVHLLPAYDEFLISYKNRSASLSVINNKKAVSVNGIFYPIIVLNGQVTGIWKRSFRNGVAVIEPDLFHHDNTSIRDLIDKKAVRIGRFLNKTIEVRYQR